MNNRCVSAPHDDMRRRRRESHGWRGLARSGRVVRPREGDDSLIDARLVALASINLGGSCHCEWANARLPSFARRRARLPTYPPRSRRVRAAPRSLRRRPHAAPRSAACTAPTRTRIVLLLHAFWRVSVKKHTGPRVSGANLEQIFLTISLNTRGSPQVHILSSATSEVSL